MKIKTIDTNSNGYKLVREGYSWISGAGAVFTTEAVVLPFVELVWRKHPIVKALCYAGTCALATGAGLFGMGVGSGTVDSFADIYNRIADGVNGNKEKTTEAEPKPEDKVKMYRKDFDILNDYIVETKMLEFDSEEEAKKALEWMTETLNNGLFDFMDVAGYYTLVRNGKMPEDKKLCYILRMHGWTAEDTKAWFVEQADEKTWIFGALNYHDISDQFVISKDHELNKIVAKMPKEK